MMLQMPHPHSLITLDEAARLCRDSGLTKFTKKWWKYHVARGHVESTDIGGTPFVRRIDVEAMIAQGLEAEKDVSADST